MSISRRQSLTWIAATFGLPAWAVDNMPFPDGTVRLAAAWEDDRGHCIGLLSLHESENSPLRIVNAIEVPTRAHGLLAEAGGTLLAVARRPGDWLLRTGRDGRVHRTHWIEPLRAFNGHVLSSPDGLTLYTTETDLDTGAGLIGVRDSASLEKKDEWPTHGLDPHDLVWDTGDKAGTALIVANGGVPTRPETGRAKINLDQMDSSLVRLDARTGRLQDQWRLEDPRLSLRHLAWNDTGTVLGIALQAQHDAPLDKNTAPVLALFDGTKLRAAPAAPPLSGYGGDVAAAGTGFAVSCPRTGGLALFGADGRWQGWEALSEACPLATSSGMLWAGGRSAVLGLRADRLPAGPARWSAGIAPSLQLRLDNHWVPVG